MMKRVLVFVAALAIVSSSAMAVSLLKIEPLAGDEATGTEGRAITPDGKYVAGVSNSHGIFWDATNGSQRVLSSDNAGATVATGIGYRLNPDTGETQIVVHGQSAGYNTYWFTNDNGATWLKKARATNVGSSPQIGVANTMGSSSASDVWYGAWFYNANGESLIVDTGSGGGDPPTVLRDSKGTTTKSALQGASASGRAVGRRRDASGSYQTYILDSVGGGGTPANFYMKGLDGTTKGEGWAVNADGTMVGGLSPVSDGRTGNWPYLCTNPGAEQTIVELPTFDPSNHGFATNGIVYGLSADGRYAVGMDYTNGYELAVLWDTQTMTEIDLTQFAIDHGILGGFTGNLRRAYSVGVNDEGNPVVTGRGYYTDEGQYRGFVLTIPEPASLILLGLGSLVILRRRR